MPRRNPNRNNPVRNWDIRPMRRTVLRLDRSCPHCHIPLFTGEDPGFCCGPNGSRVNDVRPLPDLPEELLPLLNDPAISRKSRILNLIFSFAAMESNARWAGSHDPRYGRPTEFFSIQGKIYHRLRAGHQNSGARWLLHDGYDMDEAPHQRWAETLPQHWKTALAAALSRVNPFARSLIQLRNVPANIPRARLEIVDSGTPEIAALLRYDNTAIGEVEPRSLAISYRGGLKKTIPTISRLWEPLAYPLFFPHGTLGWGVVGDGRDIRHEAWQDDRLPDGVDAPTTQMWHYRARLLRDPRFAMFGRLTNEYLVDMWTRELETRLAYIRKNQVERRQQDAELMGDDAAEDEHRNIYLPASFLGSRAWASQHTADCLAMAAQDGTPTFFVTMTCNSNWPEIVEALRPGQDWSDIPVIVSRVFKQKLAALMDALATMFPNAGDMLYSIQSVEFQKRGLPHAHILIKYQHDCITPADIDAVVSAEIPTDPVDADLVRRFMMHKHPAPPRPASTYCQREDSSGQRTCRFRYPHALQPTTTIDNTGRISYRRRNPGDEMVVPHCLALIRKFHCHINFEVANTSQLFQYLFKYVLKGPDRARYRIRTEGEAIDEIEEFWDGRYLSAGEACWRILGFHITRKDPAVSALPVHPPNTHYRHQYNRRDQPASTLSKLDRYFLRPRGNFMAADGSAQTFASLTYCDFSRLFRHETYNADKLGSPNVFLEKPVPLGQQSMLVIQRSANRRHVARIEAVKLSQGEAFYIRRLLQVKEAQSWEDLRTVNGHTYPTFQEAATGMGLFNEQNEAHYAIEEAITSLRTPRQIRLLFVHLLVNDGVPAAIQTWTDFEEPMSRDFYLQNGNNQLVASDLALTELARKGGHGPKSRNRG